MRAFIDRNFPALVYTRTYTHTHTHTDRNTNTDILIASSASPPHRPSYQASHPSSSCVTDACVTDAGLARSRPASTSFIVLALNILPRLLLSFSTFFSLPPVALKSSEVLFLLMHVTRASDPEAPGSSRVCLSAEFPCVPPLHALTFSGGVAALAAQKPRSCWQRRAPPRPPGQVAFAGLAAPSGSTSGA